MATIQEMLGQIEKREVLLPEFQRGYVWGKDQVRGFIRSLYRAHPTGHFLIWKTYTPPKVRGGEAAPNSYSLLLLDGQQRLTSLYVVFRGEPPPFYEGESLFFDLYFNLQTEEFRFWQKSLMQNDYTWLSVHSFLKQGLAGFVGQLPSTEPEARKVYEDHLPRLAQLDQIRTYTYRIDELSGDDLTVEEIVDIFNRVNSAGTPLTKGDLALAHVCSVWPEARDELRTFSNAMGAHGFGVDLNFLLRCLAAVASGSLLLEGTFYRVPVEDLQQAWKKVKNGFEHLVNVVRHDAFIDKLRDLPSANVLIPPTVFLARTGGAFTDDALRQRFIRWMHLAGIWARYSGSTDTKLQRDISVLEDEDPVGRLIEGIIAERGRIHLEGKDLVGKSAQSAEYKFSYVLARARGAKDWFSGLTLYQQAIGKSNGLESHHIFPKGVLTKSGYSASDDKRLINELANRAFLTQKANAKIAASNPAVYLKTVEEKYAGALKAQSVPMNQELWQVSNFERFLTERRHLLAKAMNEYLDSFVPSAVADADKADEITTLIAHGEHEGLELKASLRWDIKLDAVNKLLERSIVKTVAGLLNSKEGGVLLIGVTDDGGVVGLEPDYAHLRKEGKDDRDLLELHLIQVLINKLGGESALAFVTVTFHEVNGKDVCQLTVEPSDHPIYVTEEGVEMFFLRIGNSTKALPLPEAIKYIGSRWG